MSLSASIRRAVLVGVLASVAAAAVAQPSDADAAFDQAWERLVEGMDDQQRHLAMLELAYRSGRLAELAQRLSALAARHPENAFLLHSLGYALAADHRGDEAEATWRDAVALSPAAIGPTRELGALYLREGRAEDAVLLLAAHFEASDGEGRPPHPVLLEVAGRALVAVARSEDERPPEAVRGAVSAVIGHYVVWLSLPAMVPMMPERADYREVLLPRGAESVPVDRWLAISRTPGAVVDLLSRFGMASYEALELDRAGAFFRSAYELAKALEHPVHVASAAGNLASYLDRVGDYEAAGRIYEELLVGASSAAAAGEAGRVYAANNFYNAASNALERGRIAQSFEYLYRALDLYGKDEPGLGSAYDNLQRTGAKLIYQQIRFANFEQARVVHLRLTRTFRALDAGLLRPDLELELLRLEAEIALEAGDLAAAGAALKAHARELEAQTDYTRRHLAGEFANERVAALAQGVELRHRQRAGFEPVEAEYRRVLALVAELFQGAGRFKLSAFDRANEAYVEAALEADRLAEAREGLELRDLLASTGRVPEEPGAVTLLRARVAEAAGDAEAADAAYRAALERVRRHRVALPIDDTYLQAQRSAAELYDRYRRFLMRQERRTEALGVLEELKARTLLRNLALRTGFDGESPAAAAFVDFQRLTWERYSLARALEKADKGMRERLLPRLERVDRAFQAAYLSTVSGVNDDASEAGLADVLTRLRDQPGLVLVLDLDEEEQRLHRWRILAGEIVDADSVTVPARELLGKARAFTEAVAFGDRDVVWKGASMPLGAVAEELGRWLLPLDDGRPERALTLVVPPEFQALPFAALQVDGEPVVMRRVAALSLVSSLRTLAALPQRPAGPYRSVAFLGAATAPAGSAPLAYLAGDAAFFDERFAAAGAATTIVTDAERLGAARLPDLLTGHDLVQLYFHGELDAANPMRGRILLPGGEPVHGYEMFPWRLDKADVVLAACEVGSDALTAAGDVVGPTFPLIVAGARSVIHSLWRADQRLASEILRAAIAALAGGHPPARALVLAQRALIARSGELPAHQRVRSWATWRIVGRGL